MKQLGIKHFIFVLAFVVFGLSDLAASNASSNENGKQPAVHKSYLNVVPVSGCNVKDHSCSLCVPDSNLPTFDVGGIPVSKSFIRQLFSL